MTLAALLDRKAVAVGEIVGHISSLTQAERLHECLALTTSHLRRLWEVASTSDLPSGELTNGRTVVFAGRNSLRHFSRFEKWFCRVDGSVVGCNRHVLAPLIGPGYFTVRTEKSGKLVFDYGTVPSHVPPSWPGTSSNSGFLARTVYGDLLDRVAWVSPDVLIGAAFRRDLPLDSYFVLTRAA